jgi:hypothetical protein
VKRYKERRTKRASDLKPVGCGCGCGLARAILVWRGRGAEGGTVGATEDDLEHQLAQVSERVRI